MFRCVDRLSRERRAKKDAKANECNYSRFVDERQNAEEEEEQLYEGEEGLTVCWGR
jgi:hypothetical protein